MCDGAVYPEHCLSSTSEGTMDEEVGELTGKNLYVLCSCHNLSFAVSVLILAVKFLCWLMRVVRNQKFDDRICKALLLSGFSGVISRIFLSILLSI